MHVFQKAKTFFNKCSSSFLLRYAEKYLDKIGRGVHARDEMEHIRYEVVTFTALPPDSVLSWTYIHPINFPSPNFKLHQGAAYQHKPLLGSEFMNIKNY